MSALILLRHGQASYGSANYDVLSELGAEQARRLGTHLAARRRGVDAVYVGPAQRHIDTARNLRAAAADAGLDLPEPSALPALDEYPALELFKRWLPKLAGKNPTLADLLAGSPTPSGAVTQALEYISLEWASGALDTGELESFDAFAQRVGGALTEIREREGRKKTVLVVTSGGPIAIATRMALALDAASTLRVAWVLANASLTEFRYRSAADLALVGLNRVPHIDDDRLLTYR